MWRGLADRLLAARRDVKLVAERQPLAEFEFDAAPSVGRLETEHVPLLSLRSTRARLPAPGRSRAEARGRHPAAGPSLVPNRALSRQICRSAARIQLVKVRPVYERAAPKPLHLWPLRRHRGRPGVRSPPR